MTVQTFTCNPFQTNSYVCHDAGDAVIVDASWYTPVELEAMRTYIAERNLTVRHLLLTHAHIDHILGCAALVEAYGMGFQMHRSEAYLLEKAAEQAAVFGLHLDTAPAPGGFLDEDDTIAFGASEWRVLHTPGHSPGSICFYDAARGVVLSGDVLFRDSIGRTDLWQGSLPQLMASIFQKLMVLPDDTVLYPGHGPATTVGRERARNPFLVDQGPLHA